MTETITFVCGLFCGIAGCLILQSLIGLSDYLRFRKDGKRKSVDGRGRRSIWSTRKSG